MLPAVIFCQSCGSQNADDARFCNMCGTSIAKVGTPGGPIERTQLGVGLTPDASSQSNANALPVSYPGGGNTMSVQLDAIGIRSTKKTWATIVGIALLLVALGGVVTFFTMKSSQHEMGGARAEDPFELGAPEVQGADDVDFVSGRREGTMPTPPTTPTGVDSPVAPDTTMDAAPSTPSTPTVATNGTTMSQTTPSTMTTMDTTTMETTTMETTTMETTMEAEPTTMETETPDPAEPPQTEMALSDYTNRVRYLVRRYYLPRSQSCFEHATRNNPSLHGQVTVSLTIGANGHVTASSVARNSTGDTELGSCLATQVRTWELTPPPGGEPLSMTLPFSR